MFFFLGMVHAQRGDDLLMEQLMESIADELPEETDYSELTQIWHYYLEHPIDLNKTNGQSLIALQFLSPLQVHAMLDHRQYAGPYTSVNELQTIKGLPLELIRLLIPFVRVGPPNNLQIDRLLATGKHDLMLRYGRVLETQQGYAITDTSRSRYLGTPAQYFVRYRYQSAPHLLISMNMKKDAGEPFFTNKQRLGFDFYSASIDLQNRRRWEHLILGDYTLQFGQGLALWNGLSFGKGSLIQNVAKQGQGLRAYSSTNAYAFFRGMAGTYRTKHMTLSPFVSYKPLSATPVNEDGPSIYSAIRKGGLHRTPNELTNRYNAHEFLFGMNAQLQWKAITIGANIMHTRLSGRLLPRDALYNTFVFRRNELTNSSLYYSYGFQNVYLFGELAKSWDGGIAYTNGLIATLSHELSVVLQHRNYQKDYHTFYGQAIAEGSGVANENGFYSGLIFQPNKRIIWVAYVDYFKFPWFRYRADAPSDGRDLLTQFSFTPHKRSKFSFRYRFRQKAENADGVQTTVQLDAVKRHQLRMEMQFQLNESWRLRDRCEGVFYQKAVDKQRGWLFYQDVIYKPKQLRLSGNIRLAYFRTSDYKARIYAFENDVLYASSFPFYSGQGFRYYVNCRYRLRKGVDVWCRYGSFIYPKDTTVGTGLNTIEGNHQSEIKLQMRFQF